MDSSSVSPKISVLMGVYNGERYLRKSIKSLLNQTFEDFEIIVVDDGSTDRTPEILDEFDDDRLRVLRNDENLGLTASLNRGLECAHGQYVARQDADDVSVKNRLEKQARFLDIHPSVALVGSAARLINDHGDSIDTRRVLCRPSFDQLYETNRIIHGSIMIRRSALEAVGGYDELFRYSQDYDLWLRLSRKYELANLREPLYHLRLHRNSVYFDERGESKLYSRLAKKRAKEGIPEEHLETIESQGITAYYDFLTTSEQKDFHISQAQTALRYGDYESAIEEVRKARSLGERSVKSILFSLLARGGHYPVQVTRYLVRRHLNAKVLLHNARYCR